MAVPGLNDTVQVLQALVAKSLINQAVAMKGKEMLIEIVSVRVLCLFAQIRYQHQTNQSQRPVNSQMPVA